MIPMLNLTSIAGRFEPLEGYGEDYAGEINAAYARRIRRAAAERALEVFVVALVYICVGVCLGIFLTHP